MLFGRKVPARAPITFALAVILAIAMLAPVADASNHRSAPLISQDPAVDNTDVYAFVSPDRPDSITMIGCYYPFQEPGGGPNFYRFADDAEYVIHVNNDGSAKDNATFVFKFWTVTKDPNTFLYNVGPIASLTDANWNVRQYYSVTRISDPGTNHQVTWVLGTNIPVPPVNIGPKSTPNYEALAHAAVTPIGQGYNVFAGQRSDPFFVDVAALFDLLTIRPGPPGNAGGGKNTVAGYNVNCIALQSPISFLTKNGAFNTDPKDTNAILGIWMSANRPHVSTRTGSGRTSSSDMIQVSRLGMPLVNEVVIPLGLKDAFNGLNPTQDAAALSKPDGSIPVVQDPEIAKLLHLLYGINVAPAPRNDLVQVFLTGVPGLNQPAKVQPAEMLRINTAIPVSSAQSRLGVLAGDTQGFPNGRRLTDDVVDIELRVAAGVLVDGFNVSPNDALGDGVDYNEHGFQPVFPYLQTPYDGYDQTGHDTGPLPAGS
jgi:hypothetical protein